MQPALEQGYAAAQKSRRATHQEPAAWVEIRDKAGCQHMDWPAVIRSTQQAVSRAAKRFLQCHQKRWRHECSVRGSLSLLSAQIINLAAAAATHRPSHACNLCVHLCHVGKNSAACLSRAQQLLNAAR